MNIIKISFCLSLGVIAYKSFSKNDLSVLYKITLDKISEITPYFKKVINNINNLLSATNNFDNLTNNDEINKKLIKLNESINEINEKEINNIKFRKIW